MAYITQSDIENVFGAASVQQWSQLDPENTTDTDTVRVAAAIAYAEAEIDDRFRGGRYVIPFSPVPALVVDWAAKLAGVWLYNSRGVRAAEDPNASDVVSGHRRAAMELMDLYIAGTRRFANAVNDRARAPGIAFGGRVAR